VFAFFAAATVVLLALPVTNVFADDTENATNYTYNYDYWTQQVASPDAYRVGAYVLGSNLTYNGQSIGNFKDPEGLFVKDNRVYVCDSGANRIVQLEAEKDGSYTVTRIITGVTINGTFSPFNDPMDIFEARDGDIYIADTNNHRALHLDHDFNFVQEIDKPVDQTIDPTMEFLPIKIVSDFAGRIYIQARNINKGLMEFDNRGQFTGYMGANKVKVNIADYVWKLLSSKAQRAQLDLSIPTEYNNLCLDDEGFIYVTNSSGQTDAVRRLNSMGTDILIRNGYDKKVQGDLAWGNAGGVSGASKFIDVAAMPNDSFACFDRSRGRIFVYDFQGNLLYAFGGLGNREGYFQLPAALCDAGDSLYALDSRSGALTRFDPTEYGALINGALIDYKQGKYDDSASKWEQVLKMNGNYDQAYIGIGRAALRQGAYQKAMKYYKLKHYRTGYAKAFQFYRKDWMEDNLWKILLVLAIIIFVPMIIKGCIKLHREVVEA
jgi:hypothetical protein